MSAIPSSQLLSTLAPATAAYKRRAWIAMAALAAFVCLYFALAGWFVATAWQLIVGADPGGKDVVWGYLVGACAAFLALFMLKAVFFVKRGDTGGLMEITAKEQPRLFKYLHQLADEAHAPRPHRVYLSPQVNAAVFYDLSLLNLLLPSKKNLEIGLGLVNVLTLGELRAVLAHEFGHFTQRTMAIGRWVYITQQIAAHLVARRDKLDGFLMGLSQIDLRVAWIGWVLRLIVWSIRSIVETAFQVVLLVQRALSREMELQADLVAVSLTGSDALCHALHKLQAADDAWGRTMGFASSEHARGKPVRDVFALQTRILARMGRLLKDPSYGRVAPVPAEKPEAHRIFKADLAQPPQMWLTHPLNHEREENAKRRYIRAAIDPRSAWEIFDDTAALRELVSARLAGKPTAELAPLEESYAALDAQFERERLKSFYRGVYLARSPVRWASSPDELFDKDRSAVQFDQIYTDAVARDVDSLRNLEKELEQLRAVQSGSANPSGGVLRHRGRVLNAARLPKAIAEVQQEMNAVEARLRTHDRVCRTAHRNAAAVLGGGWAEYLRGLVAIQHYADHSETNLRDAQGALGNCVALETATRKVSSKGAARIVEAANNLQRALVKVYEERTQVSIDAGLAKRLEIEPGNAGWVAMLGEFTLPPADKDNIGEWLKVVDGWTDQIAGACGTLRTNALEQLLRTETTIGTHWHEKKSMEQAPEPSRVPQAYALLLPGKERPRRTTLDWWARFQTAQGLAPGGARLAVAAAIVGGVLTLGSAVGEATITIYNGLARPVDVRIDGMKLSVRPYASVAHAVKPDRRYAIETRTADDRVIEAFNAEVRGSFASYVYNVAGASALVEWTAVYGNVAPRPDRPLGAPRWTTTSAGVLFTEPPKQVKTKAGGATREVLTGLGDGAATQQLSYINSDAEQKRVTAVRARWEPTSAPGAAEWLHFASRLPDFPKLLAVRLKEAPDDVTLLRLQQDSAGDERANVCATHTALADGKPQSADLAYLAARCLAEPARADAFAAGYKRWPDSGWFAYAFGFTAAENARWPEALIALDKARQRLPMFSDALGLDVARVQRVLGFDPGKLAELQKSSRALNSMMSLESGVGVDSNDLKAYAELARGNLARALQLAASNPQREPRIVRLAAASDGASAELIARALALPANRGVDEDTAWASIALAARMKHDPAPYFEHLKRLPPEHATSVVRFIAEATRGEGPQAAQRHIPPVTPEVRGQFYALGVVLLGDRAPQAWREGAKGLLFAYERPYFR